MQLFCKQVIAKCNRHQLAECLDMLLQCPQLDLNDLAELESIDACLTKILVATARLLLLPTLLGTMVPSSQPSLHAALLLDSLLGCPPNTT